MRSPISALVSLAAATLALGLVTPCVAADEVVASDPGQTGTVVGASTSPTSGRTGPTAVASRPRTIVVTLHGGRPVALFADGFPVQRKARPGSAPATFTGLRPGTTYTVIVGGKRVGKVTAVDRPTPATGLIVRTADTPDAVVLTWTYVPSRSTGGSTVSYDVVASSETAASIESSFHGRTSGRLSGLDPAALYTFSVTPHNSAGDGAATTARMTATLAQIRGATPAPSPTPTTTPTPSPTATPGPSFIPAGPAPAPAPAQPAPPATKTIYVCPDSYVEVAGGLCQQTRDYTFHPVTETAPYTYHSEFIETSRVYRDWGTDWSGTTCPYGGTMHDGHCLGWDIQGFTISVKDGPAAGWLDNGTSYVRTTQVKDPLPAGFADDGTHWVRSAAKEARVVPA